MEALAFLGNFGLSPIGIIHVGANYGQEYEDYRNSSATTVIYIEPITEIYLNLKRKVEQSQGHYAVQAVCSSNTGDEVDFNVASNHGESSSMLNLGNHGKIYPSIIYERKEKFVTVKLDDLIENRWGNKIFNLLVIDTQGADLLVLKGAKKLLTNQVEAVYVEVSEIPLYEGGCTWPEIEKFLASLGFFMKSININTKHWGNAFFVKNKSLFSYLDVNDLPVVQGENIALNRLALQSSVWHENNGADPNKAVNGVKDGKYSFHTALEKNPWWQVDLGRLYSIDEVHVYNRLDAASNRAYHFMIKVSQDNISWKIVYERKGESFGGINGSPAIISLAEVSAVYLRIELDGENYLHLDEVEVYGDPILTDS